MKSFKIFLSIASVLLLSSCVEESPSMFRIGFSQCAKDSWRVVMNEDINREAMLYDNLDVEILVSDRDNQLQIADIRQFISEKVDLLIVSPNEEEAISTVVDEAEAAGIPVIIADRNVSTDSYVSYIGADNRVLGALVADHVNDILPGKGNIVEITGSIASTPAMERSEGFGSNLRKGIDIVAIVDGYWEENVAYEKMKPVLAKHPDIDLVFAQNDAMAYGAYRAAREAGREKDIKFLGIDGLMGEGKGVDMVKNGILEATFLYPNGAGTIMETALSILEGKEVPHKINLSSAMITPTNVRLMELQDAVVKEQHSKLEILHDRLGSYSAVLDAQRSALFISLGALAVVIILVFVLVFLLRKRSQLNRLLTEQKDTMEQLARETEKSAEAKMSFFTNISHDLRTPLSLISGPAEELRNENLDESKRKTCLDLISRNTDILARLVNQLLDFRKYDEGEVAFHPQKTDLKECLERWNESFVMLLNEKEIDFRFVELKRGRCLVNADKDKLERIYFNILSNAFKFTPTHGQIDVSLSRSEQGRGHACIRIHNTGTYIPPEERDAIFTRFYQSDSAKSSSGIGIGLSMAKIYTEMHGGAIEVDSNRAKGTTFSITLPLLDETAENTTAYGEGDKPVILVIDDNPDMVSFVTALLQDKYSVLTTTDSAEGLKTATELLPDLIISDIMMPGMDGLELVRKVKSSVMSSHIPMILLTAKSLEEQRAEGYESGADSYITKPFRPEVLLSRIDNLLQSREILRKSFEDGMLGVDKSASREDGFMTQLRNYVSENLSNSSLGVDDICFALGTSRTQLYRKVKSLTGLSTNEYIRIFRLKRAKQLLNSGNMNVSQTGYEVGFNSTSYFVKCFKDYFGETPNDYLSRR